jgi:hypothetical protein
MARSELKAMASKAVRRHAVVTDFRTRLNLDRHEPTQEPSNFPSSDGPDEHEANRADIGLGPVWLANASRQRSSGRSAVSPASGPIGSPMVTNVTIGLSPRTGALAGINDYLRSL